MDRIDRIDRRQPGDEPTQPTGVGPADQGEPPASPEATPAPPPDREDSATGTATAVAAASLPHVPRASGAHRAEAPPRAPRRHTTAVVVAGALVLALAAVVAGWQVVSRPTVEQRAEPDTVIEPVADGDTSPSSAEPTPTVEASASPTATAPPVAGDSPGPQRTTAARTAPRPANVVRFALDGARKREAKCPQGVTWSSDRTHGPSAVFDHGGRHCLTSGPVVDTAGDFTVSAWIKLGVRPSDLSMTAVSQDGQTQSGFYLQYSGFHRAWAFNRMSADVMNPNGNATATSSAPVTLEWTHLTGTYHAGSKTLQVYVNGVAGTAVQQHSAWRATGSLVIGRAMWNGERGNFVHGQVADVRVWNRTLSAQEVSRLPGSASAAG
ncbi:LamG-like jellyroll fold domain-containing protein [Micromonospora sp. NPDC004336]